MKNYFLSLLTMIVMGVFCMVSCSTDSDSDDEGGNGTTSGFLYIDGEKWNVNTLMNGAAYFSTPPGYAFEFSTSLRKEGGDMLKGLEFSIIDVNSVEELKVGNVQINIFNFKAPFEGGVNKYKIESGTTTVLENNISSVKIKFDNLKVTVGVATPHTYVINGTIIYSNMKSND